MSLLMPLDLSRQRMIREYMKKQEESAGGLERLSRQKLIIKGQAKQVPIYNFPLGVLAYHKGNGRIKAEVLEKEAELGRELNASDEQDQENIKRILLSIQPYENEKIKEDLRKNTQMFPGIITCDGIVINGNRRKALLEELYRETHDEKYNYLDVHVLPSDVTKRELWLIEANIQLSAPQQLDYSPINHLLKLREGMNAGLQVEEMAARIYGVKKEKIQEDLARLDLIDEYLRDYLDKEEKYYLVRNLNEHFINLQSILDWAARPRGAVRRNWIPDENDIEELKLVGFKYIRIRYPHLRIRDLRELFAVSESWNELKRALDVEDKVTPEDLSKRGIEDDVDQAEDYEEELEEVSEEESLKTIVEEKDLREEAIWRDAKGGPLKSFFQDAKEQAQIVKDSERPLILARKALKNINAIPDEPEKLEEPAVMDGVLREIVIRTNALRKLIQKRAGRKRRSSKQSLA